MKASEIVESVSAKVLSPDHDDDVILGIINRGLVEIAGGGDRVHGNALIAPLPDLFTSGTAVLTAPAAYAVMPTDYQRSLVSVSCFGETLKRCDSLRRFLALNHGETGTPEHYHLAGNKLWVYPVPSVDTSFTVYYYKTPATLTNSTSPDAIPVSLQAKLLVNYACREIFSEIEQGLDGKSPDTIKYDTLYQKALTDLERYIGPEDAFPQNIDDDYITTDNII